MDVDGDPDFDWYATADLSEYAGKWVVIVDRRVVESGYGSELKGMLERARRRFPDKESLLALVPGPEALFLSTA